LFDGFTSDLFNDIWGRGEEYIRFVERNPKERDNLQDLKMEGKKILAWILNTRIVRAWAGLIWLRIGAICGRF